MQRQLSPDQAKPRGCSGHRWSQPHGLRRLLYVLAALWLGLLLCGAPIRALADLPAGDHAFLYEPGGPVDVTSTYYNSGGQDYLVYGSPIAVRFDYEMNHVYDLHGNLIGYLTTSPPP
jgi:hypothetical protein